MHLAHCTSAGANAVYNRNSDRGTSSICVGNVERVRRTATSMKNTPAQLRKLIQGLRPNLELELELNLTRPMIRLNITPWMNATKCSSAMELRLREIEAFITSTKFRLHSEINRI
jgi:hypothetical protein